MHKSFFNHTGLNAWKNTRSERVNVPIIRLTNSLLPPIKWACLWGSDDISWQIDWNRHVHMYMTNSIFCLDHQKTSITTKFTKPNLFHSPLCPSKIGRFRWKIANKILIFNFRPKNSTCLQCMQKKSMHNI